MPFLNAAYSSLDDRFKPVVKEILTELEKLGYQPIVAEGRRTQAQEDEKVRLGYSQTKHSIHLTGMAADIVDKRFMWNIPLHHKFWYDLGKTVENYKVDKGVLTWGGVWAKGAERWPIIEEAVKEQSDKKLIWFMDVAHVQLTGYPMACPMCKGAGYTGKDSTVDCPNCKGTGKV